MSTAPPAPSFDPAALHRESVVFNALDCTPLAWADETYLAKLAASGVTAFNHATVISQGYDAAVSSIVGWQRRLAETGGRVFQGRGLADVRRAKDEGGVAWFVGFEDSKPIGDELWRLESLHQLGLRFLGLTYQNRNFAGDGSGESANGGLSRFGRSLVRECNRLGVALDLSHTGERSTLETIELSGKPVLVTHAGLTRFVDSPRNKSDQVVRELAARGGVFGLAAKAGFLSPGGLREPVGPEVFADNVDHLVELVGVDHVIVGTDVGDERKYSREGMARVRRLYPEIPIIDDDLDLSRIHPVGMGTPADLPRITEVLAARGYRAEDLRKILGGNLTRVLADIWDEPEYTPAAAHGGTAA
ncbi:MULTISPECIES: dipeptidase [unclassified Streptomyces]|uniref:dipeptidase n=1 Tax=unclassified Streptomyces TaxID=2593676 RepID=UPI0015E16B58|nr:MULTISPECIES: membrane dipeptidase [unclassified Streptomyces]